MPINYFGWQPFKHAFTALTWPCVTQFMEVLILEEPFISICSEECLECSHLGHIEIPTQKKIKN